MEYFKARIQSECITEIKSVLGNPKWKGIYEKDKVQHGSNVHMMSGGGAGKRLSYRALHIIIKQTAKYGIKYISK